eukprot:CAMPEP_0172160560 /NCGR_PEP_ID=MMETSP1050-20130122/5624_1 /TAXON_ID=233186 /ORGANISM="Cryptomonas curvata, Strain CCAP979/52" /LENGTH=145 /DNA_ID=CAMNT_0012830333 /DNA_START=111 /DNA_END=544 /DNA_ORIENTATION=+
MSRRSRKNLFFSAIWLVVPLAYFPQLASSSESSCSWSYNELHWDFESLVRHRPQRDYKLERGSWNFHFNPCSNTLRVPSACKELHSDAVASPGYQILSKDGEEACYLLGNLDTQEFGLIDEQRPEEGVRLTYRAGTQCDGRTGRS